MLEDTPIEFVNKAPTDKEWTAHIHILNEFTPADYQLRHIVGYIQAGPHYPKDMHQDLIEQYFARPNLEENIKYTALRPLAHAFGNLARQIDSGDYELPKTVEEAEVITEKLIEQAWKRIAKELK
jgi:hypothetical protein